MDQLPKQLRLQRKRRKGFRLSEYSKSLNGLEAKCVTRGTKWGNPFSIGGWFMRGDFDPESAGILRMTYTQCLIESEDDRFTKIENAEQSIAWFRWYAHNHLNSDAYIIPLLNKNLACWCSEGSICHADVWLVMIQEWIQKRVERVSSAGLYAILKAEPVIGKDRDLCIDLFIDNQLVAGVYEHVCYELEKRCQAVEIKMRDGKQY